MDEQKKKIIIIGGVVVLVILVVILVVMFRNRKPKIVIPTGISSQKELKKNPTQNIIGSISSVDAGIIEIISDQGEKIVLTVPSSGVSFKKQTLQEDGSFLNEDIGLFDLPKNKEVKVQYNGETNELMMIVVK